MVAHDWIPGRPEDQGLYALGTIVGGTIFGAIHAIGWNLEFPSPIALSVSLDRRLSEHLELLLKHGANVNYVNLSASSFGVGSPLQISI